MTLKDINSPILTDKDLFASIDSLEIILEDDDYDFEAECEQEAYINRLMD
jgi:hypothetical protein